MPPSPGVFKATYRGVVRGNQPLYFQLCYINVTLANNVPHRKILGRVVFHQPFSNHCLYSDDAQTGIPCGPFVGEVAWAPSLVGSAVPAAAGNIYLAEAREPFWHS